MNRHADKIRPSVCEVYRDRVENECLQNKEFLVVLFSH